MDRFVKRGGRWSLLVIWVCAQRSILSYVFVHGSGNRTAIIQLNNIDPPSLCVFSSCSVHRKKGPGNRNPPRHSSPCSPQTPQPPQMVTHAGTVGWFEDPRLMYIFTYVDIRCIADARPGGAVPSRKSKSQRSREPLRYCITTYPSPSYLHLHLHLHLNSIPIQTPSPAFI